MNIYVGNLAHSAMENDLRDAFEQFGEVARVNIPTDRESGRPRGFGFVEMPNDTEAQAAIAALNGTEIKGREVSVNEARPRTEGGRPGGGGGRGGFRSGGGGGGRSGGGGYGGGGGRRGGW